MSECKHQCIILKRICVFILGVVIGFGGGFKYYQVVVEHRVHDRLLRDPVKPQRNTNNVPKPRKESFFDKKPRVSR